MASELEGNPCSLQIDSTCVLHTLTTAGVEREHMQPKNR